MSMVRVAEAPETEADLMTCGVAPAANTNTKATDFRIRIINLCCKHRRYWQTLILQRGKIGVLKHTPSETWLERRDTLDIRNLHG